MVYSFSRLFGQPDFNCFPWITCILIAALPLLLGIPTKVHAGWLSRKSEGWAWYEERQRPLPPVEETVIQSQSSSAEQIAEVRDSLEEKLSAALLDPTETNVLDYMVTQQRWVNRSAEFSQVWAKVLLANPYLDASLTGRPTTQYGIQLHEKLKKDKLTELIRGLAHDHGLFFFYEGESPISQAFAQVVKGLSNRYGWSVVGVSTDGALLPGLENNREDNGISQTFGIEMFPALYVVNPSTEEVTPIAFGLASLDQVEKNIELQFAEEEVVYE